MKRILTTTILSFAVITAFSQINWQKGGNNAAPPGSQPILGTNYNAPLRIHTNGVQRMIITQQGRVGIGAQAPTTLLQVDGQPLITGDLFRTIGPGNLDNVWRMETPGIPIT